MLHSVAPWGQLLISLGQSKAALAAARRPRFRGENYTVEDYGIYPTGSLARPNPSAVDFGLGRRRMQNTFHLDRNR